jgi:hypothetical protein
VLKSSFRGRVEIVIDQIKFVAAIFRTYKQTVAREFVDFGVYTVKRG